MTQVNTMTQVNSETAFIENVIHVNTEVSRFFKTIQEKAKSFELRRRISALYSIHSNIVQNLKIYMAQKREFLEKSQSAENELLLNPADKTLTIYGTADLHEDTSETLILKHYLGTLRFNNDQELVGTLEKAEMKCFGIMREMIKNNDTLRSTHHVVAHQMDYLKRSCEYLQSLKAVC